MQHKRLIRPKLDLDSVAAGSFVMAVLEYRKTEGQLSEDGLLELASSYRFDPNILESDESLRFLLEIPEDPFRTRLVNALLCKAVQT